MFHESEMTEMQLEKENMATDSASSSRAMKHQVLC
jgi:hypothetical protein